MLVLGAGIGGSLQVLVVAVQNAVSYADLGAATAGATFFRSIGGSFGTAIFGAVFSNVLAGNLAASLHGLSLPHGRDRGQRREPGGAGPSAGRRSTSATSPATPPRCIPCSWWPRRSAHWRSC